MVLLMYHAQFVRLFNHQSFVLCGICNDPVGAGCFKLIGIVSEIVLFSLLICI